jgi:hypothetical protein
MWPAYNGKKQAVSSDDVAGIQAIYGARQADVYNTGSASNSTFATAASLTSLLDPSALTAVVNNLDITSTSAAEYYTVTAPRTTSGAFTVDVQSTGLSLLTPAVTVYAADQVTVLSSATGAGLQNGANLAVTVNGVTAGQQFYVQVTGADTTQFSTGNYALSLNFGTGPMPIATSPNTQLLNSAVLNGGGALALAVADMMTVSDGVTEDASYGTTGFPHGGGCGCALCRGATNASSMAATVQEQQQNLLGSEVQPAVQAITLNPWDSISNGSSALGSQASDAYFVNRAEGNELLALSESDE